MKPEKSFVASYGQPGEWQASQMAIQTAEKSTDTHYSKRLTGAASIFATVGLAIPLLAACGSSAGTAPSNRPSIQPTHQPSTTIMVEPSAMPSQSIKVEVTPPPTEAPTPSPEATLKPMETIIESKHEPTKPKSVALSIENAYDAAKTAGEQTKYTLKGIDEQWNNYCLNANTSAGGDPITSKVGGCQALAAYLYKEYKTTGDINFYNASKKVVDYIMTTFPPSYTQGVPSYLRLADS